VLRNTTNATCYSLKATASCCANEKGCLAFFDTWYVAQKIVGMPDGSALGRIGWLRFGSWEDDCEPSTVRSRFHFIQKGWTIQSYAAGVCAAVGAHNSTQSCGWCQGGIGLAALTSGQPPSALYLLLVLELDGKESLKACHFPTPNPFGNFLHCTCDTAIKSNSGALASCNPACPSLLVHIRSGELHRVRRCMTRRSYAVSVGRDWNAWDACTHHRRGGRCHGPRAGWAARVTVAWATVALRGSARYSQTGNGEGIEPA